MGTSHGLALACSRCGREAPAATSADFGAWRGSGAVLAGDAGDWAAGLLVCPDCMAEVPDGDDVGGEG